MAGIGEGVEFPDISVLRQLCRAELSARLDSVSTDDACILRSFLADNRFLYYPVTSVPRPLVIVTATNISQRPSKALMIRQYLFRGLSYKNCQTSCLNFVEESFKSPSISV